MELAHNYDTAEIDNDTDTDCSASETQPQLLLNQVRSIWWHIAKQISLNSLQVNTLQRLYLNVSSKLV